MRRRTIALVLAALAVFGLSGPGSSASPPPLIAYRGVGSWVDIYDDAQWNDPAGTIAALKSHGVRTLFLETSNYKHAKDIIFPKGADKFIDAAHAAGMKIVAWYLPGFQNIRRDFRSSMAAIDRVTSTGQRFDSFGLDIESEQVTDPSVRTQRLLRLSARLRDAVGPSYPLGAIIPSPWGMNYRKTYWPGFPFAQLAKIYDVFAPMSYFTWHTSGPGGAHSYITYNITTVRQKTGRPTIPIHIIGGIADETSGPEVRAMVHAARERGILGVSLYDFSTSGPEDWKQLAQMPSNPVESPALPVPVGYRGVLGNVPGADRTHPKEVFYSAGGISGSHRLRFQVFDVQAGEVSLLVNWRKVAEIRATGANRWSGWRSVAIDPSLLRASGTNTFAFVATGAYPSWTTWGVRGVELR